MELSLKPIGWSGEREQPRSVICLYEVVGLPEGHGALIQNLDPPRTLWSILRIRHGTPEDRPTGNYRSAEEALDALLRMYDQSAYEPEGE